MRTVHGSHTPGYYDADVQQACSAAQRATPLSELSSALVRVSSLRDRVITLSEKLCGATPPQTCGEGKQINEHGGIYGAVEEEARRLNNSIDDMNSALARIERGLP